MFELRMQPTIYIQTTYPRLLVTLRIRIGNRLNLPLKSFCQQTIYGQYLHQESKQWTGGWLSIAKNDGNR